MLFADLNSNFFANVTMFFLCYGWKEWKWLHALLQ